MGLWVGFDVIDDLGFMDATPLYQIEPDYSIGCDTFVDVFCEVATTLVPVDTGYLQSTIDADNDGVSWCEAFAEAEYAQYVEYGTWCMEAQPYFEEAYQRALQEAWPQWEEAVREAQQEEAELQAMGEPMIGDEPTLSFEDNLALINLEGAQLMTFFGIILGTIAFTVGLQLLKEITEDIFAIESGGNGFGSRGRAPEVEIT